MHQYAGGKQQASQQRYATASYSLMRPKEYMSVAGVMRPDSSNSLGMYTIVPAGQDDNSLPQHLPRWTCHHKRTLSALIAPGSAVLSFWSCTPFTEPSFKDITAPCAQSCKSYMAFACAHAQYLPTCQLVAASAYVGILLTVCSCADVACVHVQHPTEPKVCDLAAHAPLLLAPLEQHVCCLEVTVHHADGVQVVQP